MAYVVEKVDESRLNVLQKRMYKGKWVVLDPIITVAYEYFSTQEEAEFYARMINTAEEVSESITEFATEKLNALTPAEREFLRDFVGGFIMVTI